MTMATDLLLELEPVVAENFNRHLSVAVNWMPHEYVPWSQGRDFAALPWHTEQSRLSKAAQAALELNLLTEDNLPGYHFTIADRFGLDGAWGSWVNRWTAEEGRHSQCLRDYLLVTRGVDPVALERSRMAAVQAGFDGTWATPLEALVYVAFQELATRVAHRNTGRYTEDPIADQLLARIAADENLHMIFYRSLVAASLEIDPSATVQAIRTKAMDFGMPGRVIPGFAKKSLVVARAGIYNLRIHHDDVIIPLLRHWAVFDLTGLDAAAEAARAELAGFLSVLDANASRQEELILAAAERTRAKGGTLK